MKKTFILLTLAIMGLAQTPQKWDASRALSWQKEQGWLVGCNYINASSVNQLEMWQESTFRPQEIDKELGWAEKVGYNFIRVFLHDVAYNQDPEGFKKRINIFLDICQKHKIKVGFVFFDDCWYGNPKAGAQEAPSPGVHNSFWQQSPSFAMKKDSITWLTLEAYVKDIIGQYSKDKRVILWDLYNEPGNNSLYNETLPLLRRAFRWAREVSPSQPLTTGVWQLGNPEYREVTNFQLAQSDIISFHNYGDFESMKKRHTQLLVFRQTGGMYRILGERIQKYICHTSTADEKI